VATTFIPFFSENKGTHIITKLTLTLVIRKNGAKPSDFNIQMFLNATKLICGGRPTGNVNDETANMALRCAKIIPHVMN